MNRQLRQVQLGKAGRIVIPAGVRRDANMEIGDVLDVSVDEDGRVVLEDRHARLRKLRGTFAHLKKPGESVVDEFIAERRAMWGEED